MFSIITPKRFMRRSLSAVLALALVLPATAIGASAAPAGIAGKSLQDVQGHWAQTTVQDWYDNELLSGYADGTFHPNQSITRADFVLLLDNVFHLQQDGKAAFADIAAGAYYADAVSKAVAAGIIQGYADGTFGPAKPVTREEAAVMLYRAFAVTAAGSGTASVADQDKLHAWSKEAVQALLGSGYIKGYADGTFGGGRPITRAEAVTLLDRIAGEVFHQAGEYTGVTKKNALINTGGVTLKNAVIEGNLYVTEGVGEGDVTLENVTVKGETRIYGGGEHSVLLNGVTIQKLIVDKKNGKVRIVAKDGSIVKEVALRSGALLEEQIKDGAAGFGQVLLDSKLPAGSNVGLTGSFDRVGNASPNVPSITLNSGTITLLDLLRTANVTLPEGAVVDQLNVGDGTVVHVSGKGKVTKHELGNEQSELIFDDEEENGEGTGEGAGGTGTGTVVGITPTNSPTFTDVSVHDPSVIKVENTYYVFGSHLAAAKTNDLMNWTLIDSGVHDGNKLIPNVTTELKTTLEWAQTDTLWAADVIQLADGKYYMYYNACKGDSPLSALGVAVSDNIEGPYTDLGIIVKSGMVGASEDGTPYNVSLHPNTVDPDVFFDKEGKLWMVYGSYSGGIFILKMDPATAKPYPGQGYGKRLMGGDSRIEASYMLYSPETNYYYLFTSFGGFGSQDGYNMRIARSANPDGPFYDAEGNNMDIVRGPGGADNGDTTVEKYGVKLMGNYQFSDEQGNSIGYMSPGHNSAYYDEKTGQYYVIFHTRFPGQGEGHQVRVHQMFMNDNGWLVTAPYRYTGEKLDKVTADKLAGDYQYVNHGKEITGAIKKAQYIRLHADGTITGKASGTWALHDDYKMTLNVDGAAYEGVAVREWDPLMQQYAMTFTAVSEGGVTIWGSRMADESDGQIVSNTKQQLDIGNTERVYNNIALPVEGYRQASITWASTNEAVVSTTGVVTRPAPGAGNQAVTLTATITRGTATQTKTFSVYVIAQSADPLLDGLVAQYNFEDNLNDATGAAGAGTAVGNLLEGATTAGAIGYDAGVSGQGAVFNGQSGVKLPSGLIKNNSYSVSMWLKPKALANFSTTFFGARDKSSWISFLPSNWDGKTMLWSGESWYDAVTGLRIAQDKWSQVTFTVDNGSVKVYVNGALRFSGTGFPNVFTTANGTFSLGVNYWDTPFEGMMDDVRIYEVPLAADKVAQIVDASKPPVQKVGLVAHYTFDGDLADETNRYAAGTVTGAKVNEAGGTITYGDGVDGQAAVFNGASGVNLGSGLIEGSEYSVSLWLKPQAYTMHTPAFFGLMTDTSWVSLVPYAWDSNTMLWSGTAWYDGRTNELIPLNQWSNVTFTVKAGTVKIYMDGVLKFTGTNFPDVFNTPDGVFSLGVNKWDTPYKGFIDDLRIYDTELTDAEVAALTAAKVIPVDNVTLDQTSKSLLVGESFTLTATAGPANAADKAIVWSTSDSAIATVADGVVTAVAPGTATITASSAANPAKVATATIEVSAAPEPVASIDLGVTVQALNIGQNFTPASVQVLPSNAFNKTLTWASSDPSVALVDAVTGRVTALRIGAASITAAATDGSNVTAAYTVNVTGDGMTAHYTFDNVLTDAVGGYGDGTVIGAKIGTAGGTANYAAGVKGQAFAFDGSTGIQLPDGLISSNQYSVSLWLNPEQLTFHTTSFFGGRDNTHWLSIVPQAWNSNTMLWSNSDQWVDGNSGLTIPVNQWTHVSITVNNGTLALYINGVKKFETATFSDIFTTANGTFSLGVNWFDDPAYKGLIDDVRIYGNTALSSDQVANLAAGVTP